jgi:hypothetical protein
VLIVLVSSCGNAESSNTVVVRDSAGVEIVEHGRLPDRIAYRLTEPVLVLDGSERDPLETPTQGVILSNGSLAIGDVSRREVIFFDSLGAPASRFGGPGQGPNEIRSLRATVRAPDDAVVVQDAGNQRVTILRMDEEPSTYRFPDQATLSQHILIGATSGEAILLRPAGFDPNFEQAWLSVPIGLANLTTGAVDTIAQYDWVPRVDGTARNVFGPTGSIALAPMGFIMARGDKPETQWRDFAGATTRIVRWEEDPPAYTENTWEAFASYYRDVVRERDQRRVERELSDAKAVASGPLPYVGRLINSAEGEVWVGTFSADPRFDSSFKVFGSDGAWVGTLHVPARFRVLDVGFGYLLGLRLDELDVPQVGLYELVNGEG